MLILVSGSTMAEKLSTSGQTLSLSEGSNLFLKNEYETHFMLYQVPQIMLQYLIKAGTKIGTKHFI